MWLFRSGQSSGWRDESFLFYEVAHLIWTCEWWQIKESVDEILHLVDINIVTVIKVGKFDIHQEGSSCGCLCLV